MEGDVILVTVVAHYPKSENKIVRNVELLQVFYVSNKLI